MGTLHKIANFHYFPKKLFKKIQNISPNFFSSKKLNKNNNWKSIKKKTTPRYWIKDGIFEAF